jgi:hypothetical protein
MGIISEYRKYKKQKEILTFLNEEYGITKDDLQIVHEAIQYYKNRDVKPVVAREPVDEATKQKLKKEQERKLTPEQIVEAFAGEMEEFYPYGKPKSND